MYHKVLGAVAPTGLGAVVLPNTGGNVALTVAAVTSLAIGGAILLSTVIRAVANRAYKA
ncbi:MAG TPA: hypothetical protein VFH39_03450 [Candidatus Saccharimonadales bacterium]|nr:hypothetical protein [Candidatus Saccharimonadales bacterium]